MHFDLAGRRMLLVLVTLFGVPGASLIAHAQEPARTLQVVNVSRGDVIRVQDGGPERVVMLYGVTCPEPHTPVGAQARKFTQDRIADRDIAATVRYRQPSVEYVEIRLEDGRILNHQLLLAGLGKLDTLSAAGDDAYAALQEQARTEQVGVWRPGAEDESPADAVETQVIPVEDTGESAVERFKRVKQLQRDVDFAVTVEHWRNLSDADKASVRSALQQRAETRAVRAEEEVQAVTEEFDAVSRELETLEAQIAAKEQELEDHGQAAEDQAVLEMYERDSEMVRLQRGLEDARAATEIAVRDYGGGSTTYYRTMEDEDIAAELLQERQRTLAVEERNIRAQYAEQRRILEEELVALEDELTGLERDYGAVETAYTRAAVGADTRAARTDAQLTSLDQLDQAVEQGYRPPFRMQPIGVWRGQGPSETPAFDVNQDVWVIDYDAGSDAGQRQLQITVLRESDNGVVRQIVDNTLPHQSFTSLTDQGSVYLRISAPDELSWSITATGYASQ